LLYWLIPCLRPLTLQEAAEASALDPQAGLTTSDRVKDPYMLIDFCSSLVIIGRNRYGQEVVRFAHPSFHRYLESRQLRNSNTQPIGFAISVTDAHTFIATSCLRYISQFRADFTALRLKPNSSFLTGYHNFPLLEYASNHWSSHYAFIPSEATSTAAESLAIQLLYEDLGPSVNNIDTSAPTFHQNVVYSLTCHGLTGLVRRLLEWGASLNGPLQITRPDSSACGSKEWPSQYGRATTGS